MKWGLCEAGTLQDTRVEHMVSKGGQGMNEQIFTNARLVLSDRVVLGSLMTRGGRITALVEGATRFPEALDLEGDYLLPGLVELHTDNLERHVTPRPGVHLPPQSAVLAHDAEIATAGITTVFDAIGVGDPYGDGFRASDQGELLDVLDLLHDAGVLRSRHYLHVRCELPAPNARALFEPFAGHPRLKLLSLMDHTPGQRQWTDIEVARAHYTAKKGWSEAKFARELQLAPERQARHARPNRDWFVAYAREHGLSLATHDDTTLDHVDEALELGASVSEFPTTLQAARRAKAHGLAIVAGAPNIVRGGSHSGNVAAMELAHEGLLDALSSDYAPTSLLAGAWRLHRDAGFTLSAAIRRVSLDPARACGLLDRGEIAVGRLADLVRVKEVRGMPVVREVWRDGSRVA